MIEKPCLIVMLAASAAGCSGVTFSNRDDGNSHPYRVASPALKVVTDPDCKMTAEVISIPGRLNYLSFRSGLGSSDATVIFEPGGTIKQISSKQSGVADDLAKLIGVARGVAASAAVAEDGEVEPVGECTPAVAVYPIVYDEAGVRVSVDKANPILDLTNP